MNKQNTLAPPPHTHTHTQAQNLPVLSVDCIAGVDRPARERNIKQNNNNLAKSIIMENRFADYCEYEYTRYCDYISFYHHLHFLCTLHLF